MGVAAGVANAGTLRPIWPTISMFSSKGPDVAEGASVGEGGCAVAVELGVARGVDVGKGTGVDVMVGIGDAVLVSSGKGELGGVRLLGAACVVQPANNPNRTSTASLRVTMEIVFILSSSVHGLKDGASIQQAEVEGRMFTLSCH